MANPYLRLALDNLQARLTHQPTPDLIEAAAVFLLLYPRADLPDYIDILAHGNPDLFDDLLEIVRDEIHAEERQNHERHV